MATSNAGEPSPQKSSMRGDQSLGSLLPIAAQHVAASSEDRNTISDVSTATPFATVQSGEMKADERDTSPLSLIM